MKTVLNKRVAGRREGDPKEKWERKSYKELFITALVPVFISTILIWGIYITRVCLSVESVRTDLEKKVTILHQRVSKEEEKRISDVEKVNDKILRLYTRHSGEIESLTNEDTP